MTKLRAPLRDHLQTQLDESSVQRIWAGVRRRRGGSWVLRRPAPARWVWSAACALVVLSLLVIGLRFRATRETAPRSVASGPLVAQSGSTLGILGGKPATRSDLADGSSIELSAGSRLEVLENTAKTFVSVLRSGRGSFAVQPGGPRRWTIEAGLATVEVVGTRFAVTRTEGSVEVSVEHGVVLVRSELIQDHVQRLSAGQRLSIRAAASETRPVAARTSPSLTSAAPTPSASSAHLPALLTVQELLDQADERRRRGDVRGAEAALRAALAGHASEPQAAVVAFTLGKLLLDAAGRPGDAAQAFARCLSLTPPSALAEDALYRLAEAQGRSGDLRAASRTANQYQARYPSGRHTSELKRWAN